MFKILEGRFKNLNNIFCFRYLINYSTCHWEKLKFKPMLKYIVFNCDNLPFRT